MRKELDNELIGKLYCDEKLTGYEIAHRLGRSPESVYHRLRVMGCMRGISEAHRLVYEHGKGHRSKSNYNLVQRLYCDEKLSTAGVAEKVGSSPSAVASILRKLGCIRSISEANKVAYAEGRNTRWWPKGESNPSWKGGKSLNHGYPIVVCPEHPRANSRGYVLEHILVWEETHGKPLPKDWVIHHLNGIKTDNRPFNLRALPTKKHEQLLPILRQKLRELEVENRQLRRALEDGQMVFYVSEN